MYGWINDSIEALVLEKFGAEIWDKVKAEAKCDVPNGAWVRHQYYDDATTYALAISVGKVLNLDLAVVLEVYGDYFYSFVMKNGYEGLLGIQGETVFNFLCNINRLHKHLAHNLPQLIAPEFMCEIEQNVSTPSLLFTYRSSRVGLAPLVVGVTKSLARVNYNITLEMTQLSSGEPQPGIHQTVWRLTMTAGDSALFIPASTASLQSPMAANASTAPLKCPFTGTVAEVGPSSITIDISPEAIVAGGPPVTATEFQAIFPFHILFNSKCEIISTGSFLEGAADSSLIRRQADSVFTINAPAIAWNADRILAHLDSPFELTFCPSGIKPDAIALPLKGGMYLLQSGHILFLGSPNLRNQRELAASGLQMSQLPMHDATRDMIMVGEHLMAEMNTSHKLDQANKMLAKSKLVTAKEQADDDVIRGLTVASFFMFLWLFLEIIDIITDFIALSRILETPTLSSYFDAYITLVSLATILSVYLVYDRSVVLYSTLKQRFSGTLKMKVIDGIMNGEASSEYSKKQMKLQLLLAKRRGLIITIALAICEDIPSVIINLLIIGSGFSSGINVVILLSLCTNLVGLGFKLRGIDTLATVMQDIAILNMSMAQDQARLLGVADDTMSTDSNDWQDTSKPRLSIAAFHTDALRSIGEKPAVEMN